MTAAGRSYLLYPVCRWGDWVLGRGGMLNNLEFRPLVSRFEFHLSDSKSIVRTSPPVLCRSSSCLLTDLAPSGVTSLYILIFPFSTGSFFPWGCLNSFVFTQGRKIFFLNSYIQLRPYLSTLLPHHTFWKLSAITDHLPATCCVPDTALVTHSTEMAPHWPYMHIKFNSLLNSWSPNNMGHWWPFLALNPTPLPPVFPGLQGGSFSWHSSPASGHSSAPSLFSESLTDGIPEGWVLDVYCHPPPCLGSLITFLSFIPCPDWWCPQW